MHPSKLIPICLCSAFTLAALGIWTWGGIENRLAGLDALTPLLSLGVSRFLNLVLLASGGLLLFFLLLLIVIYLACREDAHIGHVTKPNKDTIETLEASSQRLRGALTR
jgi:hypothetical protein